MSDGQGHSGAPLKGVTIPHTAPTVGQVEDRLLGDHILCPFCYAMEIAGVHVLLKDEQAAWLEQEGEQVAGGQILTAFL